MGKATIIPLDVGLLRHLKRPTRNLDEPDKPAPSQAGPAMPATVRRIRFCLALLLMGFTWPDRSPDPPVSSYLTVSPLPSRPNDGRAWAVCFLLHFPWLAPVGVTHHRVLRSPDFPPEQSLTGLPARPSSPPCDVQNEGVQCLNVSYLPGTLLARAWSRNGGIARQKPATFQSFLLWADISPCVPCVPTDHCPIICFFCASAKIFQKNAIFL